MDKNYDPKRVEEKQYKRWLSEKKFYADPDSTKEKFSIVIPPPNVTGILHMGHALNNSIQDLLIRYWKLRGREVLWMPGTDHAGIATQNVVERKLAKDNIDRHKLGREAFVKEVWSWKEEYQATITGQLKKLGSACDWDRERFTMDEGLSKAVRKVFVQLYNAGLIYKGKYIINWCPRCNTALSDEEAEHKEDQGSLWHFRYPFSEGGGHLTVATTRPETMLGDTAVAVNPSDERYGDIKHRSINLPLVDRDIPLIEDEFVDKEFGTGAVKVTPAHDPNDFDFGLRHNQEPIVVIDRDGRITGPVPERYKGLDRFEARRLVVEDMEKAGLLEKVEEHTHSVGHCYRCDTVVEPSFSDQWFVKMKPLAERALEAAYNDDISFYPGRWKKVYIQWMEGIRDWCISRQIWWGHRIPVWYCSACNEVLVKEEDPDKCTSCGSSAITQETDVLDTWFSSWLWPFSTMGWPDEDSTLMKKFYPTDVLVTAPEILFFWVARMIMSGLYFTDRLPFRDIVLHGTVRDKTGKKMSKSLGNAIDPLEIIEKYGADSLRFSMLMITAEGADVYLAKDTFEIGRNFGNKLWNASRFFIENMESSIRFQSLYEADALKPEDIWILSRLQTTVSRVRSAVSNYRFNEMCRVIYDFTWHDFCDWYIEIVKKDLKAAKGERYRVVLNTGSYVLSAILRLLHPVMPFVTEEIWGALRERLLFPGVIDVDSIMDSSYPETDDRYKDTGVEEKMDLLKAVVTSLRTIRSENNVSPGMKGSALVVPDTSEDEEWLSCRRNILQDLANLSELRVDKDAEKPEFAGQGVVKGCRVYLNLEGLIDPEVEANRLNKEIQRLEKLAESTSKRVNNQKFLANAPKDVVDKEKEKEKGICQKLEKLKANLDNLSGNKSKQA